MISLLRIMEFYTCMYVNTLYFPSASLLYSSLVLTKPPLYMLVSGAAYTEMTGTKQLVEHTCVWEGCYNILYLHRWDMSKSTEDIKEMARPLEYLNRCASLIPSRLAKERLGSKNPPLLKVEPDHIIPNELHLLLRVTDVLLRNII